MTQYKAIGRGTWIDKLASEMIQREKDLGRNMDMLRVESGLGASGIPHIGSMGDAVRAFGVKLALEDMGYKAELVAYSDDLDGLRKVPEGLDESLHEYIAKPVSTIPDPDGCYDSYGMRMSSLLLDGLDKAGITYRFQRAYDTYKEGLMERQIDIILSCRQRIGAEIAARVGQDKYVQYLPYYPVCAGCGKIYTTKAHEYLRDRRLVRYECGDAQIGGQTVRGCGHAGNADIRKDLGKLAWKTEFAARWSAFDIRFEAYGKDIMDSVAINDWVADNILEFPHPHHVKYEMFLDKGGKKISKSLGNVITAQRWFRYGSAQSVLLLLYKRITGARELGFDDIPLLMNEYNDIEDMYFGRKKTNNPAKEVRMRGLYEYVNLLRPPARPPQHVNYMLLVELARIFREDRVLHITKKLAEYGVIKESDPHVEMLIEMAGNYADDFAASPQQVQVPESARGALQALATVLEGPEPQDLQNSIYLISKEHDVAPRDFFRMLYNIILGTDRGPRIGPFILDIGMAGVGSRIREVLRQ